MAVYVDNMNETALGEFGRMKMSHMIADTRAELMAMAEKIGVQAKWIQKAGAPNEHFDIAQGKRALAVQAGAVEVTMYDLVRKLQDRRREWPAGYFT